MKKFLFAAMAALLVFPSAPAYADDPIPVLISISPTSGDIDGGNSVTLTGRDFVESTVIRVDGVTVSDTLISSTEITIVMPAHVAGRVSVAAFAGMSGAVLPNAYEYIDIPDPEPSPTPTPTSTLTPTPTATPTPDPSISPTPTPTISLDPTPSPSASVVSGGSLSSSSTVTADTTPTTMTMQPLPNPIETTSVSSIVSYPIYRYTNNVTVYTGENIMNVNVSGLFTKRMRATLQKKVNNTWLTINVAYRNNLGELTFYGVPLSNGLYRIVNAGKPIKWFRINNVIL